jgi:hypothetical protein
LLALTLATGFGTRYDDHWPPARWRGVGTTSVLYARSQETVDHLCGRAPKNMTTEACVTTQGVEVLPDPCTYPGEYARIVCHENAHRFRNWPGDHPL